MKTTPERLAEAFLEQPTWATATAAFDASLDWTGEDEERNPMLKKARTLAALYLREHEECKKTS